MSAGTWYTHMSDTSNIKSKLIETKIEIEKGINSIFNKAIGIILLIVACALTIIIIYIICRCCFKCRKNKRNNKRESLKNKRKDINDEELEMNLDERKSPRKFKSWNSLTNNFVDSLV